MNDILGRIYRDNRRGLYLFALSITRSSPDAEDAIHDAFARLCKTRPNHDLTVPYVFAAVRNAALDHLRSPKTQASPGPLAACLTTAPHADSPDLSNRERDLAIAHAVDDLPEDLRTPVFLRSFASLTFRQIAELTQTPLQTVVSRYHAGLKKLGPPLRKWL